MSKHFTEEQLGVLRAQVAGQLSSKRFVHVAAVEKAAERLAALYCPEKTEMLRAAALLHDITKEYSEEKQLAILAQYHLPVSDCDRLAPKTHHARTAAALIPALFPAYADPELIACVRWHTTGHAEMTLPERLLYLADYIDESRKFHDCVILRGLFWGAEPEKMTPEERLVQLRRVLIESFDLTIAGLLQDRTPISPATVDARNALLAEKAAEGTGQDRK